ncbi:MAG: phenylalanine--tRNA ligase subunit beta [Bacteroidota bacterium]|nr:phenylalanine--tRNA ligase subunit beta [Bacteroidota bacterium]
MRIPLRWLSQYVDVSCSVQELAERLTRSGLEVAAIEAWGDRLEGVIVGRVLDRKPHPQADRLWVCRVDVAQDRALEIVCGAPNVAPGQKVAVALPGAVLPVQKEPGKRLEVRELLIRGVRSEGMLCAEDELGLGEDHSGILVLPPEAPVGEPLAAYLGLEPDVVLQVEVTPNRADLLSIVGVAREVAALTDRALRLPSVAIERTADEAGRLVRVSIEAPEACFRYAAKLVRNVRVGPSPRWLADRLRAAGLRPINNVVDATNFVMLEIGQPLHAFDLAKLAGPQIRVRLARSGETITTLDGRKRDLEPDMLLICDAEKPIAIAGVMGGANSEVDERTTDVLLESACFEPTSIRRTAKRLGLVTEAAYRFERGVDPEGVLWAVERAARLIAELSGGEVVAGTIDQYVRPLSSRQVRLRLKRVNAVLGSVYTAEEVARVLERLGIELEPESEEDSVWRCRIPSYRPDLEREIDLIEEVGRIRGWDALPVPERMVLPYAAMSEADAFYRTDRVRDVLAGMGLWEVYANSLLSEAWAEPFVPAEAQVRTLNPISADMAVARPSLIPGLLRVASHNQRHQQEDGRFFEFGRVFRRHADSSGSGYAERLYLGLLLSGAREPLRWDRPAEAVDWFDMRGLLEAFFEALGLDRPAVLPYNEAQQAAWFRYPARLRYGGRSIGWMALSGRALEERFELRRPVAFAELDWEALLEEMRAREAERRYKPFSRLPVVERDIALLVPQEIPAEAVEGLLWDLGRPEVVRVTLFDLYQGERIPAGMRSLAYRLRLAHPERTLTDAEVASVLERLVRAAGERLGAQLRQ